MRRAPVTARGVRGRATRGVGDRSGSASGHGEKEEGGGGGGGVNGEALKLQMIWLTP